MGRRGAGGEFWVIRMALVRVILLRLIPPERDTAALRRDLIITHIFAEIAGFHLGCNKLIMNGLKTCASRTPNSAVARL